jgi:glutaredoxin
MAWIVSCRCRDAVDDRGREIKKRVPAGASVWKPAREKAKMRRMSESREVVVYSRKGCHLCEIVKESLSKLERRGGFRWREVDVDSDDELRRKFTDEVPVVFIDGRKAFKYHMDEREFLRKVAG